MEDDKNFILLNYRHDNVVTNWLLVTIFCLVDWTVRSVVVQILFPETNEANFIIFFHGDHEEEIQFIQ